MVDTDGPEVAYNRCHHKICLELTKVFDQCLVKDCKEFELIVSGKLASEWEVVGCEVVDSSQRCTATIQRTGGPNFRTVHWTASGTSRVIIRNLITGDEQLHLVPFSFSGDAFLWAPRPDRMFGKCEISAHCIDVHLTDESVPGETRLGILTSVILCLIVKTAGDVQFEIEEPDLCPLPAECVPPPVTSCPPHDQIHCTLDEFTIPQKPRRASG